MSKLFVNRFSVQHVELTALLEILDQESLYRRPPSGKWSIHEHLAHLGCYQETFDHRITSILSSDQAPLFSRYRAEEDPTFPSWTKLNTETILSKLIQKRLSLIKKLEKLNDIQWNKEGKHPKLGVLTLREWLQFFVLHESHHMYAIFVLSHHS